MAVTPARTASSWAANASPSSSARAERNVHTWNEHPDFELMCEPRLSICCFRYRPAGWDGTRPTSSGSTGGEEQLDRLNERLMTAIHADGRVYCSNAVDDGRFGLRACIVNFRTEAEDVERLLAVAAELSELEQQRRVV